jgi:hypothetical protein
MTNLPMQPIVLDEHGTPRFLANPIVRYLLDAGPYDLNHLAKLPNIPREFWEQFAQLIGYSVSGFGDLSYAKDETVQIADSLAIRLLEESNE